jgi:hypothetical protein
MKVIKKRPLKCPICTSEATKVIYYGIPVKLCNNIMCNCLFGIFAPLAYRFPFKGWFYSYEGSYTSALFAWIFGRTEDKG